VTVSQSMNMTTDRQYSKTLEDLLIMAEMEKQLKEAPVQALAPAATSTPKRTELESHLDSPEPRAPPILVLQLTEIPTTFLLTLKSLVQYCPTQMTI